MVVRGRTLARASGLRKTGFIGFALAATVVASALSGCSGSSSASDDSSSSDDGTSGLFPFGLNPPSVTLTPNVKPGKRHVSVDTKISVAAADGTIDKVLLYYGHSKKNAVAGSVSPDRKTWTANENLEPGERYRMVMRGENTDGKATTKRSHFRTEGLTLDEQTYMQYIQPYDNATVGVGMPVVLMFDIPVTDKASIERSLHVTSTPKVQGSWHWFSDTEVHYRPKHYWPVGTKVHVNADINGVSAGNGIYGQESQSFDFTIGRKVVSRINLKSHKMKVFINDKLVRTIPVTGGMPGYETRSGTKVIMEKYRVKRMDAATTGVSRNDPEYYNIPDVPNALRVTWSGEFIHGAPWSEADQGFANVSHGCVGMSVANSAWMYDNFEIGDVVKVTGSSRSMEPGNGWTDWNDSWGQYAEGSALH